MSAASEEQDVATVPPSIGRVLSADGRFSGTCFLISKRYAVTAAHVVAMAMRTPDKEWPDSGTITVDFWLPSLGKWHRYEGRIFKIARKDDVIDLAILELDQDLPFDPIPLATGYPKLPVDVICWGYVGDSEQEVAIPAKIIASDRQRKLIANLTQVASPTSFAGFSGAPAVDPVARMVLGVAVLFQRAPGLQFYLVPSADVLAFLGPEGLSAIDVERAGVDADTKLADIKADAETAARFGSALNLSCEPPESLLRLNFHEYALAIARVLRDAHGEFCMAILGRWGSGKTRLARLVQRYMTSPASFASELGRYALPHAESDSLRYSVVWFSAWQYRRVPEAWIYLYETFSKSLVDPNTSSVLRIARVLRVNVARRGEGDLVFRLCALGAVLAPLQLLGGVAHVLIPLLGILGVYQLISVMRRGPKAVKQIAADYATLAQHGEKLGLQASIGIDLRALLRGWIMEPARSPESLESALAPLRPRLAFWAVPAVMAVFWAVGLYTGIRFTLPDWLSDIIATNPMNGGAGTRSVISWGVFSVWCWLTISSAALLIWPRDTTDRILLVVDDLDRCMPQETIDILEALKLLLEDPALAERVQVLVLVDEEPLAVAIREKFKALIEARAPTSSAETVREHKEKLFLCTLRLPELSPDEVKELLETYTALAPGAANQTEGAESIVGGERPVMVEHKETATTNKHRPDRITSPPKDFALSPPPGRTELYTQEERQALSDAVASALQCPSIWQLCTNSTTDPSLSLQIPDRACALWLPRGFGPGQHHPYLSGRTG